MRVAENVLKVCITMFRSRVETFLSSSFSYTFQFLLLDKTTNKPTDKTTTDQPTDIPTNNPNKNSTETTINPTEKPTNEPTDNPTNKPTDNPTNKPTDKQCNGDEKCTADDVNSYCNTDTGACECKKGFTVDEASNKCVKGMYHNAIISI